MSYKITTVKGKKREGRKKKRTTFIQPNAVITVKDLFSPKPLFKVYQILLMEHEEHVMAKQGWNTLSIVKSKWKRVVKM